MTQWLAVDTATSLGSVAVGPPGDVAAAEITLSGRRQAAGLVPALEVLLRIAGTDWASLTGVVIADGPGSFTGLRIGLATVKGLVREQPGLAVRRAPSLLGAAWGAAGWVEGPIAAVYDALRGEVFAAVFRFDAGMVESLLPPQLTTPEQLLGLAIKPALAVGDGAAAHAQAMRAWTGRAPVGPPWGAPRGSALLALLGVTGGTQLVEDIAAAEPTYGRAAEAQARWERTHGRPLPHSSSDAG